MDCQTALEKYTAYLETSRLRKETIRTYNSCMRIIAEFLASNSINNIESFRGPVAADFFKSKGLLNDYRQFIKYLSAIRKFEKNVLRMNKALIVGETEKELFAEARRYKYDSTGSGSGLSSSTIERKINGLRNKKLKTAMRLGLRAGLRVSEIARLRVEDVEVKDNCIIVDVMDGKGGKDRTVTSFEDPYLANNIKEIVKSAGSGKLFYSDRYFKTKAKELEFQMHDLRRAYARELLKKEMEKGSSRAEAISKVKLVLGHVKKSTTDIYLRKGKRYAGK